MKIRQEHKGHPQYPEKQLAEPVDILIPRGPFNIIIYLGAHGFTSLPTSWPYQLVFVNNFISHRRGQFKGLHSPERSTGTAYVAMCAMYALPVTRR